MQLGGSGANLKLSEWASVAEIGSAIAVVVTLIYVGFEIKRNTAAVVADTRHAMIDYGRQQSEILVTNAILSALVEKGEANPSSLTAHERSQFYEFTIWRIAMWETSFLNHKDGLVEDQTWLAWDRYYRGLFKGKPGYLEFWRDNRISYDPRFVAHVDSVTKE